MTDVQQGLKTDAGKPQLGDFIKDFGEPLIGVTRIWEYGAHKKYRRSNWKFVEEGDLRYSNAMIRHYVEEENGPYDSESGILHAASVAWCALARLKFIMDKYPIMAPKITAGEFAGEINKAD